MAKANPTLSFNPAALQNFEPCPTTGCYLWTGSIDGNGYGYFRNQDQRIVRVHRAMYWHTFGPVPVNLHVCHRCDVRSCMNPAHLFLGTDADNLADMRKKGRGSPPPHFYGKEHFFGKKTHCVNGHEFTPENTYFLVHRKRNNNVFRACVTCAKARAKLHRVTASSSQKKTDLLAQKL